MKKLKKEILNKFSPKTPFDNSTFVGEELKKRLKKPLTN
jgi:hypothetical protein